MRTFLNGRIGDSTSRQLGISKPIILLSILLGVGLSCSQAFAWGERGHHIVAAMAARMLPDIAPSTDAGKAFARFFTDRSIALGHLAYIPDSSWRNEAGEARISAMNISNHYFGPERLLGFPASPGGPAFQEFLNKVRQLPADYRELTDLYEGKENALPGVPAEKKKLLLYEHLGTTPWRAQELYDLLVSAFTCAKQKEGQDRRTRPTGIYPPVESPFREPHDGLGAAANPPLPSYVCQSKLPRESDLHAAVVLAGVLAHFIGDQGQPYHPTADYDGWVTGNGGIHAYFESNVVRVLDERLSSDVLEKAREQKFRRQVWENVGTDTDSPFGVARLLINMAADAVSHKSAVRQIDDEVALIKTRQSDGTLTPRKSASLEWGDYPWRHPEAAFKEAERLPASTPEVMRAFRPIVVERLATSAVVLATAWLHAWQAAGSPDLSDQSPISLPYPLDAPFIWPAFDRAALQRSKQSEPDARYPAHWWEPVREEEGQWWEILPQEARPGEVVLSKRNELGVFSNFAHTPFYFHGSRYLSVEGFWYMLAYPEGADDPRMQHPGIEWKHTRKEVSQMIAFEAKEAGALAEENMRAMGINWVTFEGQRLKYWFREKGDHYRLIVKVLWEKVRQNPDVQELLLSTGDLILIPDNFDSLQGLPAWRYFDIYMQFRQTLKQSGEFPPSERYPSHWWAPVPEKDKQWWEVLPQGAGPGEVIVSKRNELGILSNFAPTAFEFHGRHYASVEGFWQMMLYPEGPDDARARFLGLTWAHTREGVSQMTAFEAKQAGELAEENMKKMGINWVTFNGKRMTYRTAEKGDHYRLIVETMQEKLKQNPEVRRILLSTGDLVLRPDHLQEPNSPPAWLYNKIWMEIRSELQKTTTDKPR